MGLLSESVNHRLCIRKQHLPCRKRQPVLAHMIGTLVHVRGGKQDDWLHELEHRSWCTSRRNQLGSRQCRRLNGMCHRLVPSCSLVSTCLTQMVLVCCLVREVKIVNGKQGTKKAKGRIGSGGADTWRGVSGLEKLCDYLVAG